MDLLSLPCDLKRIIFSKVDCVSLINAKLTSREFYLFIERNIRHMQKPKLYEIYVFENSDSYGNNQYHVRFGFYFFNKEKIASSIKYISMVRVFTLFKFFIKF
uniref:F-box domain-containing protein n=1 Tax=Strongyloides papillosus TaxID=174720 RepID=A0A0N5BG18_STREA